MAATELPWIPTDREEKRSGASGLQQAILGGGEKLLICIPTSVLGKEAPWSKMTKRRAGVGADPHMYTFLETQGEGCPRRGTAPARQQSTTAWKGPSAERPLAKADPEHPPGDSLDLDQKNKMSLSPRAAGWG